MPSLRAEFVLKAVAHALLALLTLAWTYGVILYSDYRDGRRPATHATYVAAVCLLTLPFLGCTFIFVLTECACRTKPTVRHLPLQSQDDAETTEDEGIGV